MHNKVRFNLQYHGAVDFIFEEVNEIFFLLIWIGSSILISMCHELKILHPYSAFLMQTSFKTILFFLFPEKKTGALPHNIN